VRWLSYGGDPNARREKGTAERLLAARRRAPKRVGKNRDRGGAPRPLRDEVAPQGEHWHVDAAVRERIVEVVLEVEYEPLEETARRIAERLSSEELAQLVADWLDAQTAI
jgi:hypothetical protein